MKNIVRLATSEEIHIWMLDHFQSRAIVENYTKGGFVYNIVNDFARMPHFTFDPTQKGHKSPEHAHFSTWWGGILNRTYEHNVIGDLYLLHEAYHFGNMPYLPGLSFANWKQKMVDNELDASVASEIMVYFAIPGLREVSFAHDIFADRFLDDKAYEKLFEANPKMLWQVIRTLRRNAMHNEHAVAAEDLPAFWIRKFSAQNDAWAAIWAHRYNEVESLMHRVESLCLASDPNDAGRRNAALDELLAGLKHASKGTGVPWPDEAQAFDGVYRASRAMYDEAFPKK